MFCHEQKISQLISSYLEEAAASLVSERKNSEYPLHDWETTIFDGVIEWNFEFQPNRLSISGLAFDGDQTLQLDPFVVDIDLGSNGYTPQSISIYFGLYHPRLDRLKKHDKSYEKISVFRHLLDERLVSAEDFWFEFHEDLSKFLNLESD